MGKTHLHFDGVIVDVLVMVSCCVFLQDITVGGNWAKGTGNPPCNLSQPHNL